MRSVRIRRKTLKYPRLPLEEPLRRVWCQRIGRSLGKTDVRVWYDQFDENRDYRCIRSILRDVGQTLPRALLKPDAVHYLQLHPTTKRAIPSANETTLTGSKTSVSGALFFVDGIYSRGCIRSFGLQSDETVEDVYCLEGDAFLEPLEHCCIRGPRDTTRDAAVQSLRLLSRDTSIC